MNIHWKYKTIVQKNKDFFCLYGSFLLWNELVTQLRVPTTNDISIFTRQITYEWKYLISLLSVPDIGIKSTLNNTWSELRVFTVIGKYMVCLPKTKESLTMWCDLMSIYSHILSLKELQIPFISINLLGARILLPYLCVSITAQYLPYST